MPTHPASPDPSRVTALDEDRAGGLQAGEAMCPACGGSGRLDGTPCPECDGTGRIAQAVGEA